MKALRTGFCLVFVILFSACKPSQNTGKEMTGNEAPPGSAVPRQTVSPAQAKKLEARLKWNMETTVGDYNKKGTKSSKWDRPAREALTTFARVRTYGPDQVAGFPGNLAALANTAVSAGCADPPEAGRQCAILGSGVQDSE